MTTPQEELSPEEKRLVQKVGQIFKANRERVRQLQGKIVRKLQNPQRNKPDAAGNEPENSKTS